MTLAVVVLAALVSGAGPASSGKIVEDTLCDGSIPGAGPAATLVIAQVAGLGYGPCAVIASGGVVTILNPEPIPHNPANNPGPNTRYMGTCFEFAAEHAGAQMTAGARYLLSFRVRESGELEVSKDDRRTWERCPPTAVLANGDRVVKVGCTDHWSTAAGIIIVKPTFGQVQV